MNTASGARSISCLTCSASSSSETGAWLVIRYSVTCAAGWGRLWGAEIGDAIEISAADAEPRRVVVRSKADTDAYLFTPMVGVKSRDSLKLCFIPAGEEDTECFAP